MAPGVLCWFLWQVQCLYVALSTLGGKHGLGRAKQSSQLNIQVNGKQGAEHARSEGHTPWGSYGAEGLTRYREGTAKQKHSPWRNTTDYRRRRHHNETRLTMLVSHLNIGWGGRHKAVLWQGRSPRRRETRSACEATRRTPPTSGPKRTY